VDISTTNHCLVPLGDLDCDWREFCGSTFYLLYILGMSENPNKSILTIVIGFLILYLFFHQPWMIYASLAIGISSLLSPTIANWILRAWFGIAKVLGFINSRIILTLIYYLVLFPLSILSKLRSNQMILKKRQTTYYTDRNHSYQKEDLENPW